MAVNYIASLKTTRMQAVRDRIDADVGAVSTDVSQHPIDEPAVGRALREAMASLDAIVKKTSQQMPSNPFNAATQQHVRDGLASLASSSPAELSHLAQDEGALIAFIIAMIV